MILNMILLNVFLKKKHTNTKGKLERGRRSEAVSFQTLVDKTKKPWVRVWILLKFTQQGTADIPHPSFMPTWGHGKSTQYSTLLQLPFSPSSFGSFFRHEIVWLSKIFCCHDEIRSSPGKRLHSYWKWPLIVDLSMKNGDFHTFLYVSQRVRSENTPRSLIGPPQQSIASAGRFGPALPCSQAVQNVEVSPWKKLRSSKATLVPEGIICVIHIQKLHINPWLLNSKPIILTRLYITYTGIRIFCRDKHTETP